MAPPTEIKAITITTKGVSAINTVPTPQLRDGHILVRVTAVALNPTDWKHVEGHMGVPIGARVGCDYAGVVEQVGAKLAREFASGDRICGIAHGSNEVEHEDGVFAEYAMAPSHVAIHTPDNLSDEEAATLGVGIATVGQGLYQALQLPFPTSPSPTPIPLLIYGGSTATGILGIQFARESGCRVATTCSPRNADYMRSLGADAVFDYRSPTCAADIAAWAAPLGGLRLVWDCFGADGSTAVCAAALGAPNAPPGSRYRSLLRVTDEMATALGPGVNYGHTFAYTMLGGPIQKGNMRLPANPGDAEFGLMFWEVARKLLAEGKVKTAPPDVNRGGKGLEGVLVGMQEMKENKVSCSKLVYTL